MSALRRALAAGVLLGAQALVACQPSPIDDHVAQGLASPTAGYKLCATEGQECAFTGTAQVMYGVDNNYNVRTLDNGTACTNAVFGDAAFGIVKSCYYKLASATASPVPSDFKVCATEGGTCAFTGTAEVWFGVGTSYNILTLSNGAACTDAVFGNPAPGIVKTCYFLVQSSPDMSTPAAHSVQLTWAASTTSGVTYDLYRGTTHGGPYTEIESGLPSTSATDTAVVAGKTYYYVVRSHDGAGESANSNEISAVIP